MNLSMSSKSFFGLTRAYAKIVDKKKLETVNLVNNMFN